jgi:hypothetical protein
MKILFGDGSSWHLRDFSNDLKKGRFVQCCGSGTIYFESGSRSDFPKVSDPDPDPTLKKFRIRIRLSESSESGRIRIHNTGFVTQLPPGIIVMVCHISFKNRDFSSRGI